jgi:G3E family GTPase/FKBP-type peptidyl-prolyl cis-trans isomerase
VDATAVEKALSAAGSTATAAPKMVSMQNGCICCTLREDLVEQVAELARGKEKYDYLIIESTGISEPVPVAQTFCHSLQELEEMAQGEGAGQDTEQEQEQGASLTKDEAHEHDRRLAVQALQLQKMARLDTMVTVVDAAHIWEVMGSLKSLSESRFSRSEAKQVVDDSIDLERTIVDLLVDQIEFADVILLNKKDLVKTKAERDKIEGLVRKLNPIAKVYWTERSVISADKVLGTGLFDFEKAEKSAGWIQELQNGTHTPETEEYGVSSLVFRADRPFVPEKLEAILNGFGSLKNVVVNADSDSEDSEDYSKESVFGNVIRSKGQIWLANCCALKMDWHSVGRQFSLDPGQAFRAAVVEAGFDPRDEGYTTPDHGEPSKRLKTESDQDSVWGDRRSELVLIGMGLDKAAMQTALEDALVPTKVMKLAAKEKMRFEKFIESVRQKEGDDGLEELTPEDVANGTGGLSTPFDRLLKYEDFFFDGKAHESYMDYQGPEQQGDDEAEKAISAGLAALAKAAKTQGAIETDSGLVFVEQKAGKGKKPKRKDSVKVRFEGRVPVWVDMNTQTEKVFDSGTTNWSMASVISGLSEGLKLMKPGGKATMTIPSDLAYGDEDAHEGVVPPNVAVIFEVELISIK